MKGTKGHEDEKDESDRGMGGGMRVLALEGGHLEMGVQHGRQVLDLRPAIVETMERRLAGLEGKPIAGLLVEVERAWAERARTTVDMMAGIAGSLEMDGTRLVRYALASYLEDCLRAGSRAEGCTVWAASGPATADGSPLLTKNRDYSLGHLPLQALALAAPREGHRYLYVTSAGSPGVFSSGMNEAGLAIADTHVPSADIGPGLSRYTLMMEVLERHASVASALEYLKGATRMGAGNLVLADAAGEMAVFEPGYRQWGIVPADRHTVVATNHFVTRPLRGRYLGQDRGTNDESESRYLTIQRWLRQEWGRLDAGAAMRVMGGHAGGGAAICRHELTDSSGTISNVIFLPAERSLFFCNGRPCESPFVRYSL
jgi:isopenicillin-N N-acyltransferase like protein